MITPRPGKPTDNAFIESFNGKVRQECLNQHWFLNLQDAKAKLDSWRDDYNHNRPHSSIGYQSPEEFAKSCVFTGGKKLDFSHEGWFSFGVKVT